MDRDAEDSLFHALRFASFLNRLSSFSVRNFKFSFGVAWLLGEVEIQQGNKNRDFFFFLFLCYDLLGSLCKLIYVRYEKKLWYG